MPAVPGARLLQTIQTGAQGFAAFPRPTERPQNKGQLAGFSQIHGSTLYSALEKAGYTIIQLINYREGYPSVFRWSNHF